MIILIKIMRRGPNVVLEESIGPTNASLRDRTTIAQIGLGTGHRLWVTRDDAADLVKTLARLLHSFIERPRSTDAERRHAAHWLRELADQLENGRIAYADRTVPEKEELL